MCTEYCPVEIPDPFNQEISNNKAVHVYFAQAIPLISYIDENCLYLKEHKCRICEGVCENKAIDLNQRERNLKVNVGSILLSPGYDSFDPSIREEYCYDKYHNILTSMDFERILDPTGPYEGEILRPSDKNHPQKIAWLQCIGSRSVVEGDNSYCSAVCCTYTQKQVILTKEHNEETSCTIFHNDIRSHGKDFERYFLKTQELPDTRFIRCYPSIEGENPENNNIIIKYTTQDDGVKVEEFDLVVLSVGLNPPANFKELSDKFGIDLNYHGFCKTDLSNPMKTSKSGVFVSGAFQGPMDIPESVFTASAAGSQCGELLNYRRWKLNEERIYPPERDVSQEDPRIGVFVCHCGANIGRIVDVPKVVDYVSSLPNVVYAQEQLFSCATNSAQEITDVAKEKGLNRVVIAACTPRTLEPLFRDTVREAGINQYFCEMANIREHDSWVHPKEKDAATEKAKDIIRMSVARARYLEPLQDIDLPVTKSALVVGGGIAGMTCAQSIASQGHEVYLVEKDSELGGNAKRIGSTLDGLDVQSFLKDLIYQTYQNPLIHVFHDSTITHVSGYVGNFRTCLQSERRSHQIDHGATVISIGAEEYKPTEYLYGTDDKVITHLELEERIKNQDSAIFNAESIVMIQCVGCRQEDRQYCSRVCCGHAIKDALKLKDINPEMDIYILFRDMRAYGLYEDFYREAADKDIKFIRWDPDDKPQVESTEENGKSIIRVTVYDYILGQYLSLDADYLSLAAAILPPSSNKEISNFYNLSLDPDEFFKEAHVKLRPVEFGADGVYLCGMAHYPKHITETINQAYGAAGRVITLLSHDIVTVSGAVTEIDEDKCIGCGACVSACTYSAIELRDTRQGKKAVVNPVLCKGDGLCNAKCPTGAISLKHFTDQEILSQIDAATPNQEIQQQIDAAVGDA